MAIDSLLARYPWSTAASVLSVGVWLMFFQSCGLAYWHESFSDIQYVQYVYHFNTFTVVVEYIDSEMLIPKLLIIYDLHQVHPPLIIENYLPLKDLSSCRLCITIFVFEVAVFWEVFVTNTWWAFLFSLVMGHMPSALVVLEGPPLAVAVELKQRYLVIELEVSSACSGSSWLELLLSEFSPFKSFELVGVFLLHLKPLMSLW